MRTRQGARRVGPGSVWLGAVLSPWYAVFVAPEVGNAMAPAGSSFFTLPERPPRAQVDPEGRPVVVRLWGEHDISTDRALCLTFARAIALDSAGLVLDLSEVELIGPSTLGVIVRARRVLAPALGVLDSAVPLWRRPEPHGRLRPERPALAQPRNGGRPAGMALRSSVEGPAADRSDGHLGRWVRVPEPVTARIDATGTSTGGRRRERRAPDGERVQKVPEDGER